MTAKDGGAAFPFSPPVDDTGRSAVGYPFPELGMSLRDWFAGQALAGWMASFTPDCGVKARAAHAAELDSINMASATIYFFMPLRRINCDF